MKENVTKRFMTMLIIGLICYFIYLWGSRNNETILMGGGIMITLICGYHFLRRV